MYIYLHVYVFGVFMYYLCVGFFVIIFIFITINHIISLTHKNLFFGHVYQTFSLRVLLSFCINLCQFPPAIAYKSVAYKQRKAFSCNALKKTLMLVHSTRCRVCAWYRNSKSGTETETYIEPIQTTMIELFAIRNNKNQSE